jgi:hypothetical protein
MKEEKKIKFTSKKTKSIILSIIIAIVLAGFVIHLVRSIHPSPDYNDYCEDARIPQSFDKGATSEECIINGGNWTNGYCDYYSECNDNWNEARDKYRRVMFIVAVIVGLVAISTGIVLALPSVSSGLMIGGGFLMFFGTAQYWSDLSNWIRTIILGMVLVILIWLGYKKLEH